MGGGSAKSFLGPSHQFLSGRRGPMGMRSIGAEACSPFDPKPDLPPPRNSSQRRRALFFLPTTLCAEVPSCGHFQRSRRLQGSGGEPQDQSAFLDTCCPPSQCPCQVHAFTDGDASVIVPPTIYGSVLARPFSFVPISIFGTGATTRFTHDAISVTKLATPK